MKDGDIENIHSNSDDDYIIVAARRYLSIGGIGIRVALSHLLRSPINDVT
jgi:hypothetical protein